MELLPFFIAAAVAGAGAVVYGMRGRRIDDHPLCRRCGFDLVGLPAGSSACSECGGSIVVRKAIRFGHRQRNGRIVALGMILLLLGGGQLGIMAGSAPGELPGTTTSRPGGWFANSTVPTAAPRHLTS
jgi:ribosomal protein L37E